MIIRSYYRIVGVGVRVPVMAFDGVQPYTFSIAPGGAGGSIDQDGIYTAPAYISAPRADISETFDTIIATDADGETASYIMGIGYSTKFIADIIAKELGLAPDQVLIENQKFTLPPDKRLYVSIKTLTSRAISNRNHFVDGDSAQSVNMVSPVDIGIYSRTTEALTRKEEVVMALNSNYAKNQQQLNSFLIGKVGTIVPLSNIDGAAIPFFFNINVNIQYAVSKQKPVDYFDSFEIDNVITNP